MENGALVRCGGGCKGLYQFLCELKEGERSVTGWQEIARGLQRTSLEAVSSQQWRGPKSFCYQIDFESSVHEVREVLETNE